jgi:predicted negative regulator of RcsB-dependent stress response
MSEEALNTNFQKKIIFFIQKKLKTLIILLTLIIITLFSFLVYKNLENKNNIKLSEKYSQAVILLNQNKMEESKLLLQYIISKKNKFYSPLALYLIIDQSLENDSKKIIIFFDKILKIKSIDKENLNLIKIKKSIFLFKLGKEELIIKTLNPIINSNSVWRNMAIKLLSDYFLFNNQKVKAEEYIQLLNNEKNK